MCREAPATWLKFLHSPDLKIPELWPPNLHISALYPAISPVGRPRISLRSKSSLRGKLQLPTSTGSPSTRNNRGNTSHDCSIPVAVTSREQLGHGPNSPKWPVQIDSRDLGKRRCAVDIAPFLAAGRTFISCAFACLVGRMPLLYAAVLGYISYFSGVCPVLLVHETVACFRSRDLPSGGRIISHIPRIKYWVYSAWEQV